MVRLIHGAPPVPLSGSFSVLIVDIHEALEENRRES